MSDRHASHGRKPKTGSKIGWAPTRETAVSQICPWARRPAGIIRAAHYNSPREEQRVYPDFPFRPDRKNKISVTIWERSWNLPPNYAAGERHRGYCGKSNFHEHGWTSAKHRHPWPANRPDPLLFQEVLCNITIESAIALSTDY